ncbi:hypothetical protein F2P56_007208 [Juglans regia]|uniref:RNase H type-1 domain-containing protein n=2 Tax=Juglans regia TaxID=51240 RepID=A0A833Y1M2_JUGRE|nr:uncharacterized protein LOC108994248 [Juglans regia]KAF5475402.1 hypothetical protein F2P56_007208 [Juglans regia]
MDISVSIPKVKKVSVVKWSPPSQNWVNLNMNDSLGNHGPAGAGGVIRDAGGQMCAAYFVFLGQGSNNFAELSGSMEGVRRCYHLGFYQVDIKTDSQILVNWIKRG